jgi:hypothetical protein
MCITSCCWCNLQCLFDERGEPIFLTDSLGSTRIEMYWNFMKGECLKTYFQWHQGKYTVFRSVVYVRKWCKFDVWSYKHAVTEVYHSYFNSIINYGLPFWGNSPQNLKIFRIQKSIIRIMLERRRRDSCRNLFRELEILPLASQYILSLMLFVAKNRN